MILDGSRCRMITVLTGDRQIGKTTLCKRIVDLAKAGSAAVAGVISPAVFHNRCKVGICVVNLRSGVSRILATKATNQQPGELGYRFHESALAWANDAIATSVPCDVLVIDELGPLEILQNRGFVAAFEVLQNGEYGLALVVVRPELIDAFRTRLGLFFAIKQVQDFSEDVLADWPNVVGALVFGGA